MKSSPQVCYHTELTILSHMVSSSPATRGETSRGIVMITVFSSPAQGKLGFQISFALRGFPGPMKWVSRRSTWEGIQVGHTSHSVSQSS